MTDTTINVTVCELPDDLDQLDNSLDDLAQHIHDEASELLILNEVPFDSWFGRTPDFDQLRWNETVRRHQHRLEALDLGCAVVATAPTNQGASRYNQAFSRTSHGTTTWWRRKSRIPNEAPVYEASWYDEAEDAPDLRTINRASVGVLICTELWMMDWAASLGRAGAHIIASPRATSTDSTPNWLAAGRVAAITSGAYSVSSNRAGAGFGGYGWILAPDGELLAKTTEDQPFATRQLSLDLADRAKHTYPRSATWRPHPRVGPADLTHQSRSATGDTPTPASSEPANRGPTERAPTCST